MDTAMADIKIGRYVLGYEPFLADFAVNAAKFTGMCHNVAPIPPVNGQDEAYVQCISRNQRDLYKIKQSKSGL